VTRPRYSSALAFRKESGKRARAGGAVPGGSAVGLRPPGLVSRRARAGLRARAPRARMVPTRPPPCGPSAANRATVC